MSDFLFPDVGEGIHEGKLLSWKVKQGDTVKADQVLAEIETDKAIVEIPSPKAGVIVKLYHQAGEIIKVGEPLVTYGDGAATTTPAVKEEFKRPIENGTAKMESTLVPTPPLPHEHDPPIVMPSESTRASAPGIVSSTHPLAAPSTRRLARELGVDLQTVQGSGSFSRILDSDVQAASKGGRAPTPPVVSAPRPATPLTSAPTANATAPSILPIQSTNNSLPADPTTRVPYTGRRRAIGEHMVQSHQAPAVTEFGQADVTALLALRERVKDKFEKAGIKLTPLAFFAAGVARTLLKHPILNSELNGEEIDEFGDVHLGIAVDTPKGLTVPVIRNAEHLTIAALAQEIGRLAEAARSDKLTLKESRGSTFSISSIGPSRVQGFTPMLNAPEEAILGIGAIQDLPWVVNGTVVPRKIVTLSLTFDHRVIDGAEAARFLTDLIMLLEDPDALLIGGM